MTNVADDDDRRAAAAEASADRMAADLKAAVDVALDGLLARSTPGPGRLVEAMRFALLAPAKRARGVLTGLATRQFGVDPVASRSVAAAIEMVHAASLVLDDLPCMDDAALRRGRPACHRVYGEDTASLAAVALMNRAYEVIVGDAALPAALRLDLAARLAEVIGPDGLTGGQEQDLRNDGVGLTMALVEDIHRRKTAVLFGYATEAGARVAGAEPTAVAAMRTFGDAVGLAFQSLDDLLDAEASEGAAGKDVGKDIGKATPVTLLGRTAAAARADAMAADALRHLVSAGGDHAPTAHYVRRIVDGLVARRAQM